MRNFPEVCLGFYLKSKSKKSKVGQAFKELISSDQTMAYKLGVLYAKGGVVARDDEKIIAYFNKIRSDHKKVTHIVGHPPLLKKFIKP